MYVWENPSSINADLFVNVFKQRLIDEFLNKWFHDLESKRILDTLYRHVKPEFGYENYLNLIHSRKLRTFFTRLI